MEESLNQQKRQHYRIQYPLSVCPKLKLGDCFYDILDLSEKGIRVNIGAQALKIPREITAKLIIHGRKDQIIKGRVHVDGNLNISFIMGANSILLELPASTVKVDIFNKVVVARYENNQLTFNEPWHQLFKHLPEFPVEVHFHDGTKVLQVGKTYRLDEQIVVISFNTGIPFSQIVKEQLYIAKNFAGWFQEHP